MLAVATASCTSDVDADAADGGHGVGCVSDAEETGGAPLPEAIDLHGEELHFVP